MVAEHCLCVSSTCRRSATSDRLCTPYNYVTMSEDYSRLTTYRFSKKFPIIIIIVIIINVLSLRTKYIF